jgi:hypothetical protein
MIAFEKHYRVKELAGLWGVSAKTIRRMFASEPGVIRIANHGTGKRKWVLLSIPESVVVRIHETLSAKPIQTTLAGGHPLRVIRLRDLHDGKSRHPRNIIKLKAGGAGAKTPDTPQIMIRPQIAGEGRRNESERVQRNQISGET